MTFDSNKLTEACAKKMALSHTATDGLRAILTLANGDDCWRSPEQLAYGLATFKWETAHTFLPICEKGPVNYFLKYEHNTELGKRLGNKLPGDGYKYRGRGFVQITGRANYERVGRSIRIDLVQDPDRALETKIAYRIAAQGMAGGWFTGHKLDDHIPVGGTPDYGEARRIINGQDRAADIAGLALAILEIINDCTI